MNKIDLFLSVFVLLCGLNSCSGKSENKNEAPLPVLDFRKDIPEKTLAMQDLGKVRYVRFNTSDSVLLGDQMRLTVDGGNPFFYDSGAGYIVGFDKEGNMLCSFNRKGQGSEEYTDIRQFVYDEARKEVFLFSSGRKGIVVYGLDGTYKRLLPISDSILVDGLATLDKETLILLDTKDTPFIQDGVPVQLNPSASNPSEYPFVLIDKETGEQSRLQTFRSANRYQSFVLTNKDGKPFIYLGRQSHLFSVNGQCLLSEAASDTIYALSSGQLQVPLLTRLPSVKEKEGKISCTMMAVTPNTMLIEAIFLKYEGGDGLKRQQYIYNVKENTFSAYKLTSTDFKDREFSTPVVSDNKLYYVLYPYLLLEALEKNQLSGELQDVARALSEDDNPILMEVALK